MDKFLKAMIYALPVLVVGIFFRFMFHKKEDNEKNIPEDQIEVLKFPFAYRIIPFVVFIFISLTITIVSIIQGIEENWPYLILAFIITIPFLIMSILWSLWKVEIRDEDFVYRNWFGKKRTYRYEDLEFRYHPKGLKWYFYKDNKKVFCMAYYIEGEKALIKRYKKCSKRNG